MKKQIFNSKVFLLVMLLVLGGHTVSYAQGGAPNANRNSVKVEVENKIQNKGIATSVRAMSKEQVRSELKEALDVIKTNREEFRLKVEENKGTAKAKFEEIKASLQEKLSSIKDENRKSATLKIINKLQELNSQTTDRLVERVNQIESVLVRIESRISKAESRELDVTSVKDSLDKAKTSISNTRELISKQSEKAYEFNTTSDTTLRTDLKSLRDTFNKDIKSVYAAVKASHEAVSKVATSLAKIPKIDEDVEQEEVTE